MNRGKKLILLLAVFAVVLGAALLVMKLNPQEDTDTTARDYDTVVFAMDPEKVTNISWNYSQEASFTKTAEGWAYDADPAFPVDADKLEGMVRTLSSVSASKVIENVEDLKQYGLDYPFCTIEITVDGKIHQLALGDQNTFSGDRYFTTGDGKVYMIPNDVASYFNFGPEGVMALEPIPDMTEITGLKLETETHSYEILYQSAGEDADAQQGGWFMDGKALDTELTQDLLKLVQTLQWNSCANYNTADFTVYGLDTPRAILTATYGEESFVLELGDEVEKGVYAHIPGSKMVYLINTSTVKTLLDTHIDSLMPEAQ